MIIFSNGQYTNGYIFPIVRESIRDIPQMCVKSFCNTLWKTC